MGAASANEPERAARAVEEVVRFEPITPFTARIVDEEIEYRDVDLPRRDGRDGVRVRGKPRPANTAENPDEFDITADRAGAKPLTFGAGIHYCLGANLARAELEEALAFLAPRMPGLRPAGEAELGTIQGIYGVERLPVSFD